MARRKSPIPRGGKLNFLGAQLRVLRKQAGLLQSDVVARLQRQGWAVNEPILSMIERGRRGLSDWELKLILDVLGATWSDLR